MIHYIKDICEKKDIYIWGAGKTGHDVGVCFSMAGIRYIGYFDSAFPDGGMFGHKKIYPIAVLERMSKEDKEKIIVVIACAIKDVTQRLKEVGIQNIISTQDLATKYNVSYPKLTFKEEENPLISVLLSTYNEWNYSYNALESLLRNENKIPYEVIMGDDGSTDLTTHAADFLENVKIIYNEPGTQYLQNVNTIAKYARGKYLVLLSNDIYMTQKGYLDKLYETIEQDEKIGAVSGKFWTPKKNSYDLPVNYNAEGEAVLISDINKRQEVQGLWPVGTILRRDVWNDIGGFDEIYLPVYYEDADLFLKIINAGYCLVYNPDIEMIHYGGATYCSSIYNQSIFKNRKIFLERWKSFFASLD